MFAMNSHYQIAALHDHLNLLVASYQRVTGKILLDLNHAHEADQLIRLFDEASFVLLSHGTEMDPILNYGNQACLALWEMDFATLIRTPSRLTAEPMVQEQREIFLKTVQERGYIEHYEGVRISASGARFRIQDVTVWNVIDLDGRYCGQAAMFHSVSRIFSESF